MCMYTLFLHTVRVISLMQVWGLWCALDKQAHTHRESTHRGLACGAISPLSVLQSIDPAWLLSAGYVSSTAALPVRGRVKAVEDGREVEINGKGVEYQRGEGVKERMQG